MQINYKVYFRSLFILCSSVAPKMILAALWTSCLTCWLQPLAKNFRLFFIHSTCVERYKYCTCKSIPKWCNKESVPFVTLERTHLWTFEYFLFLVKLQYISFLDVKFSVSQTKSIIISSLTTETRLGADSSALETCYLPFPDHEGHQTLEQSFSQHTCQVDGASSTALPTEVLI